MPPPIQIQWSLNAGANSAIQTVGGLLAASLSDGVQPLAVLACDKLGASIAICDDTITKLARDLTTSTQPTILGFLGATVGFLPNDCSTQLAGSPTGIRFLALAAALVTSVEPYRGALALAIMMKDAGVKPTEAIPVPYLKDILSSLEAKSHRCAFSQSVLGYQALVGGWIRQKILLGQISRRHSAKELMDITLHTAPSPEAIAGLVDVLRQVALVGDSTVTGATIRVGASVPWVLAFVQWCLGSPASIYVEGCEEAILQQRGAASLIRVVIQAGKNFISGPLKAIIHHDVKDIIQLLGPINDTPIRLMVEIDDYVKWRLYDLDLYIHGESDSNDKMNRVLQEALEFAIPQIMSMMDDRGSNFNKSGSSIKNSTHEFRLSPLPDKHTIASVCSKFLKLETTMRFSPTEQHVLISDLGLVPRFLQSQGQRCLCTQCSGARGLAQVPQGSVAKRTECLKQRFYQSLARLITDILAISLFDCPTPVRVLASPNREIRYDRITSSISQILETGSADPIDPMNILEWARSLLGYGDSDEDDERSLIVTADKGQVVFLACFETLKIEKQGYLRLCVLPGTLRYKGLTYNVVSFPDDDGLLENEYDLPIPPSFPGVLEPQNLFRDFKVSWDATPQDNNEIDLCLVMRGKERGSFRANPLLLIPILSEMLMLESCPHDRHAKLAHPDRLSSYTAPWNDNDDAEASASRINVIAVADSDKLRFFAIASSDGKVLLRKDACLDCCLGVCRDTGVHVLIL